MIKKKRVAALCKAYKRLEMQTMPDNTQWIGDGAAMYILAGIEPMSAESIASILDYTEKDISSINFVDGEAPFEIFGDENGTDVQIETPPKRVIIKGSEYLIFEVEKALIFIDGNYLKPIVTDDQTTFFMRTSPCSSRKFLCVKKGFLPEAVIAGVKFDEKYLNEWFDELSVIMTSVTEKYIPHIVRSDDPGEQMMLGDGE